MALNDVDGSRHTGETLQKCYTNHLGIIYLSDKNIKTKIVLTQKKTLLGTDANDVISRLLCVDEQALFVTSYIYIYSVTRRAAHNGFCNTFAIFDFTLIYHTNVNSIYNCKIFIPSLMEIFCYIHFHTV